MKHLYGVERMVERIEALLEWGGMKKDLVCLVVSAIALIAAFIWPDLPVDPAWIAIVLCGLPIIIEAIIALITRFDVKADMLVSLAIIASIAIGEYNAAGVVAFIMQIGGFLEELTVDRARAGIERLVGLTPRTARVVSLTGETVVPAETVQVGQVVRVLPGETIPVDGTLIEGSTAVDQAIVTGESMPVDKMPGDEVFAGTVNQFGAVEIRATRAGDDGSIQRMVRLVQSADANKARVVRTADRWATVIVVAALLIALGAWLFTGDIIRAVTVLVVFCPCALVLATPTAIMAAIGNATKHGCLTREGDALERLARVTHVVFDKTGTLTHGTPEVVEVISLAENCDVQHVLDRAVCAELRSEHPLGKAIVASHPNRTDVAEPQGFELLLGRGVRAAVGSDTLLAGNRALMDEHGIAVNASAQAAAEKHESSGRTVVFVAENRTLIGLVVLADTVRAESAQAIASLKAQGLVPVLLTGDNERVARTIATELGIEEVHAGCLPEDKIAYIERAESQGVKACMVGDGVNDAPALRRSYVGIAMGGIGSDVAADAADIVLVDDGIGELPHLMGLSRHTTHTIRLNLTFAMTVNIAATVLATLGLLGPVAGALVHNIGSVLVISNSARLLRWRKKVRP